MEFNPKLDRDIQIKHEDNRRAGLAAEAELQKTLAKVRTFDIEQPPPPQPLPPEQVKDAQFWRPGFAPDLCVCALQLADGSVVLGTANDPDQTTAMQQARANAEQNASVIP